MRNKLLVLIGILVMIVASMLGCFEEDDKDEKKEGDGGEGEGFKMYEDTFDWDEANGNSNPLTGLEAIQLAVDNIDIVAPGAQFILTSSTEVASQGADKTSGKAKGWQMHFHKTSEGKVMNRIVNIAEKGCAIVKDYYESSTIDQWKYADATIDTDDVPGLLSSHEETSNWLSSHPEATVDIQTSSGPFGGPDELSWLMWYKDGSDSHQVHISAIDGEIVE